MNRVELYKLLKLKTLPYAVLASLGVMAAYGMFIMHDILQAEMPPSYLELNVLIHSYHTDICYYFIPFLIIFLINDIVVSDIKSGTLKFIVIRSSRLKIIISKSASIFYEGEVIAKDFTIKCKNGKEVIPMHRWKNYVYQKY